MDNRNANHNLVGDDANRGGVDNAEGLGAPSSRSSESGEINILDDFSEEEDDKDDRGERLKPYAENLEEAVALTMQVIWATQVKNCFIFLQLFGLFGLYVVQQLAILPSSSSSFLCYILEKPGWVVVQVLRMGLKF